MRRSNTWTIVRKEFARLFGDRQLLFTTVLMPGLLIYIIYSLMGSGMERMRTEGADETVTLHVENLPESLAQAFYATGDGYMVCEEPGGVLAQVDELEDKNLNKVLVRFPDDFDELVATYSPQCGVPAPNVEIYYNSANNASSRAYGEVTALLDAYEAQLSNRFDVNRADSEEAHYDMASPDDVLGDILSKLIPMLILMMLFSGVMAIAPSSIAGEKERGTIATLLVTPLRRNELALGKVVSLSGIALMSGLSSFLGIVLSLPRMIHADTTDMGLELGYGAADYAVLLLTILASVLVLASAVSLLSAYAKDVKNAGTMVTPLMLVVMLCGLVPMFQSHAPESIGAYLIPFYNSIEVMTATFAHEMRWTAVVAMLCSNVAYTGLAVWGLTKMFNSERVMFSK